MTMHTAVTSNQRTWQQGTMYRTEEAGDPAKEDFTAVQYAHFYEHAFLKNKIFSFTYE